MLYKGMSSGTLACSTNFLRKLVLAFKKILVHTFSDIMIFKKFRHKKDYQDGFDIQVVVHNVSNLKNVTTMGQGIHINVCEHA